ncbi:MAG: PAS domain S-box protein [Gemmatimonadota bacterium]|jgi:PAS domain S-box-containing protein
MAEKGRVLVVGDPHGTDSLHALLVQHGFSVEASPPSDEVPPLAGSGSFDLVLLDTQVADADPFELLAELKRHPTAREIPVILLTGANEVQARAKGLSSGDDLILKPFDPREAVARVERQVTVSKVRLALRESEAKFRSVMESAIDAIISGDAEGRIRSWNRAATALFGFSQEEAIGQPIEIIIPARFRERHRNGMQRVSSGGPTRVIGKTVELAAIRRDGSEFPVELSLASWFLDEERYFTGIIRDISERKQAEKKFRSVTESAIDAIISADHEGRIVSWNAAATRILGYTEEEVIGQRLEIIIPERFHEAHRNGMARYTATGRGRVIGTTVELFARRKGGEEVPIELSLSSWTVRDERYYTGIIRDIGERKRAEKALRESEQALRKRTEELKKKNEELELTLGQLHATQAQLIVQEKMASLGKLSAGMAHELNNPASAARRSADQLDATFRSWEEVVQGMAELSLDRGKLDRLAELDRIARTRASKPVELGAVDRGDIETDLEKWLGDRRADAVLEVVPELVSLGYDVPGLEKLTQVFNAEQLPVILTWLGLKHAIYHLIGDINLSTERIVTIVNALKGYTYLDRAPVQSVDVRQGLEDTLVIFRNKLKGGIHVIREFAHDLPTIEAYAGELNQVWTNIIDNAIDATDGEGTLTLRAYGEGDWVVVEIEDDGVGIPADVQPRIFDPFFTTKDPGDGTGLGLNISRNIIVQKHEGQLAVSSEPGRTCFTIRLPTQRRSAD